MNLSVWIFPNSHVTTIMGDILLKTQNLVKRYGRVKQGQHI
jgi:hypothetical protein